MRGRLLHSCVRHEYYRWYAGGQAALDCSYSVAGRRRICSRMCMCMCMCMCTCTDSLYEFDRYGCSHAASAAAQQQQLSPAWIPRRAVLKVVLIVLMSTNSGESDRRREITWLQGFVLLQPPTPRFQWSVRRGAQGSAMRVSSRRAPLQHRMAKLANAGRGRIACGWGASGGC